MVNHAILLQKSSHYSLHDNAIDWFKSYQLHSRTQNTFISGEQSTPGEVVAGVPQGSVLGPMLFLIYINDLPPVLSHSCADIFADDTTLSTHNKSLDVVITSLTNDLSHVDRWCQHNHMSINSDKSNVMFISSRQNRQILQSNTEIPYHDSVIKSGSTAKLLGVTVSNSLSWNDHIETVIQMQYISLYVITNHIISLN